MVEIHNPKRSSRRAAKINLIKSTHTGGTYVTITVCSCLLFKGARAPVKLPRKISFNKKLPKWIYSKQKLTFSAILE